jgi:hypothetical protein
MTKLTEIKHWRLALIAEKSHLRGGKLSSGPQPIEVVAR